MDKKEEKKKKAKKAKPDKPVTVHITNHNKFEKGVGAFVTNLNHLTIVMDSEGNMKLDANQVPVMPHTDVDVEEKQPEDNEGDDDVANPQTSSCDLPELIEKLKPLFYNNEENVKLFLKEINGMKDKDITDLVNKWVADKRISDYGNSRKGDLWSILSDAGLYTKSRQNWCRRVF